MTLFTRWLLACAVALLSLPAMAQLDHNHAAFDALLKKHVRWLPDGKQSRVDYAGVKADRAALAAVLKAYSAVSQAEFNAYSREQQMAFLINAYNGFTIEFILTRYPDLKSIKDLGGLLSSPWKKEFYTLLGANRHLDWIEHEQLRPKYAEPRIHAAIVCASIGCPALRTEAFTAQKLEAQLEDGMQRFLGDRTRNRLSGNKAEVSMIFKWFREDFEKGHKGFAKVEDVLLRYASAMGATPEQVQALRERRMVVEHLDYDWALNATGR